MQCDVQSLLDDAACFYATNPYFLQVAQTSLWCQIAQAIEASGEGVAMLSDDGEWYELGASQIAPGTAIITVNQTPVPPGVNPYLVLLNDDDGLLYKFMLEGAAPEVFWAIDPTPVVEPATPTVLTAGGNNYALTISNDDGLTAQLTQV